MNIVLTKRQLNLLKENDNVNPIACNNKERDGDTSSFLSTVSSIMQKNTNGADISINTDEWGGKETNNTDKSQNGVMEIPNGPNAALQAKRALDASKTNPKASPTSIVIKNGPNNNNNNGFVESLKRKGNLVEMTKFSKAELDKFLKSL